MFDVLLDLLFPRRSLTGEEGTLITNVERKNMTLTPLLLQTAVLRERGLRYIDVIISAGQYDESDELKKMILTYKYKRVPAFADELSHRMLDALHDHFPQYRAEKKYIVCPVPLHWTRKNERGFNQAEELAVRIAASQGWPIHELLFRVRRTGHQAHRSRRERLTALIGAFAVKPDAKIPKHVVLIDDLSTTGATLEECARMLKNAGVDHVIGLVAAAG